MRWNPDGRNPRPGEDAGVSETHFKGNKQRPEYNARRPARKPRPRRRPPHRKMIKWWKP